MKFAIVAASLLPLLKLSAALYIPADAETLAKFAENSLTKESAPASDYLAPFATSGNAKANLIEDSYIVVFNDDVDDTIIGQHFFWLNDHHIDAVNSLKKRDSTSARSR